MESIKEGDDPQPSTSSAPGTSLNKWDRAFKIVAVLFPLLVYGGLELALKSKFSPEYGGSPLEVQGRFRFVRSPYRHYQNNPGFIRQRDGVTYRYNNYGFRNEEDVLDKEAGEFRVFVLGGSMAYGERASERGQYQLISGQKTYTSDETISAYLERELAQRMPGRRVKVWNAAVVSYRIHHNYMTYLETIRSLEPDLLVSIDGQNEVWSGDNPLSAGVANHGALAVSGGLVTWLRQHSYTLFYAGAAVSESDFFAKMRGRMIQELDAESLARMDLEAIRAD